MQSRDTYCPAGHDRLHVVQFWSLVVVPVHGLRVNTVVDEFAGFGVHGLQLVVSASVSPLHLEPEMYCPASHLDLHCRHVLSSKVKPVQKPLMYCPGGLAANDRHRPVHFEHVLPGLPEVVHSSDMYCPSSLIE